ncbi:MAG: hypothetical protein HGB18_02460 [Candidatus Moranbacteria bacterium]|nr:hypothetical protein [Candidatus Moranbacteria bacterium]
MSSETMSLGESMRERNNERSLVERYRERPIELLEEFSGITVEELEARFPGEFPIIACDFGIYGIGDGEEFPGGYRSGRVLSVDHHASTSRMAHRISSTTLAIKQARTEGFPGTGRVVIHHTDCDSLLSSLIVSGFLPPEERFNAAAIAADHTGEPDEIADLLQPLQRRRDIEFSLRNLDLLLRGEALEEDARELMLGRLAQRETVAKLVREGAFRSTGGVYFASFSERHDAAFFPALLPEAAVILVGSPMSDDSGKTVLKIRLGLAAPDGFRVNTLGLPDFGGRWNAGNTKRHGGTAIPIEEYAELVREKLEAFVSQSDEE